MNSLDKMEDYDRLKRERDELARENAAIRELMNAYNLGGWTDSLSLMKERDEAVAQVEVMQELLIRCAEPDATQEKADQDMCAQWDVDALKALSITPSAALAEIEARALEDAAQIVRYYIKHQEVSDGEYYIATQCTCENLEDRLLHQAAAKRKGE